MGALVLPSESSILTLGILAIDTRVFNFGSEVKAPSIGNCRLFGRSPFSVSVLSCVNLSSFLSLIVVLDDSGDAGRLDVWIGANDARGPLGDLDLLSIADSDSCFLTRAGLSLSLSLLSCKKELVRSYVYGDLGTPRVGVAILGASPAESGPSLPLASDGTERIVAFGSGS